MWLSSLVQYTVLIWAPVTSAQLFCDIYEEVLQDNSVGCNWNTNMNFQDIIDNNPDLEYLRIDSNGGSGYAALGTIPDSIQTLTKLRHLELGSLSSIDSIPISIARLPNLDTLYLYTLDLDGSFPVEIFQMESLDTLYLHEIGDRLDPLDLPALGIPSIQSITIVDIPTTRNFPIEWVNSVSEIEELRLCNLKLDGVLSEIRPDRLTSLHLINNQLSGGLPRIAKNVPWEKLESLRLEGNNFVGSIPAEYEGYIRDHGLTLSIAPNAQVSGIVPTGSKMCNYAGAMKNPTELWGCTLARFGEDDQFIMPLRVEGERCNRDVSCVGLRNTEHVLFAKCAYGYCCSHDAPESCLECAKDTGRCVEDLFGDNRTVGESCIRDIDCIRADRLSPKCAFGYCCNKAARQNCLECAEGSGECINYGTGFTIDDRWVNILTVMGAGGAVVCCVALCSCRKNLQVGTVVRLEEVPMGEIISDDPAGMST